MKWGMVGLLMAIAWAGGAMGESFPEPEELEAHPELPDALVMRDGRAVETAEAWAAERRPEILRLFEHYVYGKAPEVPGAEAIAVETMFEKPIAGGKGRLRELKLTFPPAGTGPVYLLIGEPVSETPVPVFLGLNFGGNHSTTDAPEVRLNEGWMPQRLDGVEENRATEAARGTSEDRWPFELAIARGYAMATLYHGDLDPDHADFGNGVHAAFDGAGGESGERERAAWGAISAWAWGLRVAATVLIADPRIDGERVCLMGHSRNGKTALWAGAQDERFAVVVSNQSGCGGAALSRARRGETVGVITKNFPHWFNGRFAAFGEREEFLPVDQHLLLALVAPRPVLVCSAEADLWADPQGEFEACQGADGVYRLLGTEGFGVETYPEVNELVGGRVGYHVRPGKHGVGVEDWEVFFDFADRFRG